MAYRYRIINRITPDVTKVIGVMVSSWKAAGLQTFEPEPHEGGGLKVKVVDSNSGNMIELHVAEYTAMVNGWVTGSEVKVKLIPSNNISLTEFNEVALNKPGRSPLEQAMQGERKDDSCAIAENIQLLLLQTGEKSAETPIRAE